MEEYIPICPSVRLYVCHSFTAYYRQRSADISGQIPFLFGLFLRPALRNPVLPLLNKKDIDVVRSNGTWRLGIDLKPEWKDRIAQRLAEEEAKKKRNLSGNVR